jgi:hypothetical protein
LLLLKKFFSNVSIKGLRLLALFDWRLDLLHLILHISSQLDVLD